MTATDGPDPATTDHTLPASLYRKAVPGWPAGTAWPWLGPDVSPMVGTLAAKARSDQMPTA
jgi:hypothetical protein